MTFVLYRFTHIISLNRPTSNKCVSLQKYLVINPQEVINIQFYIQVKYTVICSFLSEMDFNRKKRLIIR
jgi:hypothetical protein